MMPTAFLTLKPWEMIDDLEEFDFESFGILEMRTLSVVRKYNNFPRPEISTPEQNLWAMVVLQAEEDLFLYPKPKRGKKPSRQDLVNCRRIRASAYNFLFSNTPMIADWRKFVFLSAGLNIEIAPTWLRHQADEFEALHT